MHKRFQRGEIGTILAVGALVVLSVSVFVSSVFLKNQKQTTSSRAAGMCVVTKLENGLNCEYTWDSSLTSGFCSGANSPDFAQMFNPTTGEMTQICLNNTSSGKCNKKCAQPIDRDNDLYCHAFIQKNGQNCNIDWYSTKGTCVSPDQAKIDTVNNYGYKENCYIPAPVNVIVLPTPTPQPAINPNPIVTLAIQTQCQLWRDPPVNYMVSTNAGEGTILVVKSNNFVLYANPIPAGRGGGYYFEGSGVKGVYVAELRKGHQNGELIMTSAPSDQNSCEAQQTVCAQVITPIRNISTRQCSTNKDACTIPAGWVADPSCNQPVVAPPPPPSAPANLSCAIDTLAATATFKWDAVSAEASYEVKVTGLDSQGQSLGKATNTISRSKGVTSYQSGVNYQSNGQICTECQYDWQVVAIGADGQKSSPAQGPKSCSSTASTSSGQQPSVQSQASQGPIACAQTLPFKDINSSTEANLYKALSCFSTNSSGACIVNGYADNDFCSKNGGIGASCFLPNKEITRAEALTLITRYHTTILKDWDTSAPSSVSFPDVDSHWAKQQIGIAHKNGFTLGVASGNNFNPDGEWKYGFRGVTANEYSNGAFPEGGPMKRGEFIKDLYVYAVAKGKITASCGTAQTTSGGSTQPGTQPAATTVSCPHKAEGDANCDNKIDADDILIWILQLNKREIPKPGRDARFDDKPEVTISHFNFIRRNFLKGTPGKPW